MFFPWNGKKTANSLPMTRTYWWLESQEPKNLEEDSSAIIYGEDQDNGQLNLHESLQVVDRKARSKS